MSPSKEEREALQRKQDSIMLVNKQIKDSIDRVEERRQQITDSLLAIEAAGASYSGANTDPGAIRYGQ